MFSNVHRNNFQVDVRAYWVLPDHETYVVTTVVEWGIVSTISITRYINPDKKTTFTSFQDHKFDLHKLGPSPDFATVV